MNMITITKFSKLTVWYHESMLMETFYEATFRDKNGMM